jgi:beta-phosphoglucomutase-like phosphatase (HAD superfamily)
MGVMPARVLVIEDSGPGVEAALSAGMRVAVYTGGQHMNGEMFDTEAPVRAFGAWSAFPQLLRELAGEEAE